MKNSSSVAASSPPPSHPEVWQRRVIWLAWATILYNLLEGGVSIAFGWSDASIALFGFGVDSLIEVASATLVLWRFRAEAGQGGAPALERERHATRAIGWLFLGLAMTAGLGSVTQLATRGHPDTTLPGLVVSTLSLSFMFYLWHAKKTAAKALDSATVAKDAACSLACIKLSGILLVGSLLFMLSPLLWWADSVAALMLSLLIGKEGWQTIETTRRPTFTGGCGCGHDD